MDSVPNATSEEERSRTGPTGGYHADPGLIVAECNEYSHSSSTATHPEEVSQTLLHRPYASHHQHPRPSGPRHTPTEYDEDLLRIKTRIARHEAALDKHPIPRHWKEPQHEIEKALYNALCLMAFEHAGLDPIWAAIMLEDEGDETVWENGIHQMLDRLTNMNLVAGLLLGSWAVFLTTTPPNQVMVNYTLRGPYLCILCSFALLIGGLIVGSATLLATGKARPYWSKEVLYTSCFHIYCTIIMLSYPFVSIGLAAMLLAFGLLSAVWAAADRGIQGACAVVLFLPSSIAALFGVSCTTATATSGLRRVVAEAVGAVRHVPNT